MQNRLLNSSKSQQVIGIQGKDFKNLEGQDKEKKEGDD
jgi:hypothetical protein